MSGGVPAGELLPCPNPWCERIEGVEASRHLLTKRWHVCCDDCMIEGPWANTYEEAITAWNTRATPTPPIEGRDADVERVAGAMWNASPYYDGTPWDDVSWRRYNGTCDTRELYLTLARAARAALAKDKSDG